MKVVFENIIRQYFIGTGLFWLSIKKLKQCIEANSNILAKNLAQEPDGKHNADKMKVTLLFPFSKALHVLQVLSAVVMTFMLKKPNVHQMLIQKGPGAVREESKT